MVETSELMESKFLTSKDVKESTNKTLVVLGEGNIEMVDNTKGEKYKALTVPVQLDGLKLKDWRINKTALKKLNEKFGSTNSKEWVGKPFVVTTIPAQGGKEAIIPI